tara:strand:+ start:1262 stop:1651 length:390 start_codon:yes stop_codon:yes gene_type:complete
MNSFRILIEQGIVFSFILFLLFFSSVQKLYSGDINWTEVATTSNEIQFIDINSIKYNNKGLLSVLTKYYDINPDNQEIINIQSYLMAIDCEKRLFSKLPVNGEPNQVKNWINPTNDRLIKKTIVNSCSY